MPEVVFNWTIVNLERHSADDIVYMTHWTVIASDSTYSASSYGSIDLEPPEPTSKIPYEDLTSEIVLDWVKNKIGADNINEIETALRVAIKEQQTPSKAQGVPW
jgi:hypothetical protein